MFNYLIIGSGFARNVIAERIANILTEKVLIIEKRNHIGGNCFNYRDKNGIIIHKYREYVQDFENIILVGRLADYRYYDMDDIVEKALDVLRKR